MSEKQFEVKLANYLPPNSSSLIYRWLKPHHVKIKIAKPRSSKLGDFRVNSKSGPMQISVNGNLNPYAFLITLTHEIAHLKDFEARGHLKEAHGKSWQSQYQTLLIELMEASLFPPEIEEAIRSHIERPKAASCSDPTLLNALRLFDEKPIVRLKDIKEGSHFALTNGRAFRLGQLRRTRFKCLELKTDRWFLIHGEAEIIPLDIA